MHLTSAADVRAWRGAIPYPVAQWAPLAVAVPGVVWAMISDDSSTDTITTFPAAVGSALPYAIVGALFAVLATGVYWPVTAGWCAAALNVELCLEGGPVVWFGTAAAGLAALNLYQLAHRRMRHAQPTVTGLSAIAGDPPTVPELADGQRNRMLAPRWGLRLLVVACALGVVIGTAFTARDTVRTLDFRARAEVVAGVVRSVDPESAAWAQVEIDANDVRVNVWGDAPPQGATVHVRWDGQRAEFVDDPFDPTLGALPVGGAAALGVLIAHRERARRRRIRDLIESGGTVLGAIATNTNGRVILHSCTGPVSLFGSWRAATVIPEPKPEPDPEPDAPRETDVAHLSDWELLREFSTTAHEPAGGTADTEESVWQWSPNPVTVLGLDRGPGPVLARDGMGPWLLLDGYRGSFPTLRDKPGWRMYARALAVLISRPNVDPRSDARVRRTPKWRVLPALNRHSTEPDAPQTRTPSRFARTVRTTGTWAPWILAPLVGILLWWDRQNTQFPQVLLPILVLARVCYIWASASYPRMILQGTGILVRTALRYVPVTWPDVLSVANNDATVVLRVRDTKNPGGEEAYAFGSGPDAPPLLRGVTDPGDAATAIRQAQILAIPGVGRLPRIVPSLPLVLAVYCVACCLAGPLLGR